MTGMVENYVRRIRRYPLVGKHEQFLLPYSKLSSLKYVYNECIKSVIRNQLNMI
jgi:hypothetical protein